MARNVIERDFWSSKMAAGSHFVNKIKKKLSIDPKWREMGSKVIFGHPKWPPVAILWKKKLCIDLKWREVRSKFIFGHPKWGRGEASQWPACKPSGIYTVFARVNYVKLQSFPIFNGINHLDSRRKSYQVISMPDRLQKFELCQVGKLLKITPLVTRKWRPVAIVSVQK